MENLNEDVNPSESSQHEHFIAPLRALGSFRMKGQRYLIIGTENEDSATSQLESSLPSVVCQFTLPIQDGQKILSIVESPMSEIDPTDLLTQREFEIVRLVAKGWANKQIAHVLKISQWTVSTHLRRIFLKLEVDTRAAMVYRCAVFL